MWKIVTVKFNDVKYGATFETFEDAVSSIYRDYESYMYRTASPMEEQPFPTNNFSGDYMMNYVQRYLIFGEEFKLFNTLQRYTDMNCIAVLNVAKTTEFVVRTDRPCPFPDGPRNPRVEGLDKLERFVPTLAVIERNVAEISSKLNPDFDSNDCDPPGNSRAAGFAIDPIEMERGYGRSRGKCVLM